MNKRIRELAEQAMELVDPYAPEGDFGSSELNAEKFALLILKECIDICRSEDWEDQQGWGKMYAHKIQKQFGIKP